MYLEIIYSTYMYKRDLALNDLQQLICHKIKLHQTKPSKKNKQKTKKNKLVYTMIIQKVLSLCKKKKEEVENFVVFAHFCFL